VRMLRQDISRKLEPPYRYVHDLYDLIITGGLTGFKTRSVEEGGESWLRSYSSQGVGPAPSG